MLLLMSRQLYFMIFSQELVKMFNIHIMRVEILLLDDQPEEGC